MPAPWRNIEGVEFAAATRVEWFSNRRLVKPIGDITPVEFEDMYYRNQQTLPVGAGVSYSAFRRPGAIQAVKLALAMVHNA